GQLDDYRDQPILGLTEAFRRTHLAAESEEPGLLGRRLRGKGRGIDPCCGGGFLGRRTNLTTAADGAEKRTDCDNTRVKSHGCSPGLGGKMAPASVGGATYRLLEGGVVKRPA